MSQSTSEVKTMIDTNAANAVGVAKTMQANFKDAAEGGVEKATAAFTTGLSEATSHMEKTQAQIKEQMDKAMKKAEQMASFGQGTVEAMMKCGQIWATGLQSLSRHVAASAQSQMDETVSTFKAMSSLRSLKDVMDLQASYTRISVEKAMSETGRLTDAGFKLAEETLAPLTARVTLAVETFSKAA